MEKKPFLEKIFSFTLMVISFRLLFDFQNAQKCCRFLFGFVLYPFKQFYLSLSLKCYLPPGKKIHTYMNVQYAFLHYVPLLSDGILKHKI